MAAKLVTLPYFASVVLTCLLVVSVSAIPSKKINSLKLIKQVNSKEPYIGLLTVFPPEENAFLGTADFKPNPEHPFVNLSGMWVLFLYKCIVDGIHLFCKLEWQCGTEGRRYRVGTIYGKKVIYVRCGIGMVNHFLLFTPINASSLKLYGTSPKEKKKFSIVQESLLD